MVGRKPPRFRRWTCDDGEMMIGISVLLEHVHIETWLDLGSCRERNVFGFIPQPRILYCVPSRPYTIHLGPDLEVSRCSYIASCHSPREMRREIVGSKAIVFACSLANSALVPASRRWLFTRLSSSSPRCKLGNYPESVRNLKIAAKIPFGNTCRAPSINVRGTSA